MRELYPHILDRTTDTADLPPTSARVLQRVNTTQSAGRLIRDKGAARTQMTANSSTVTSSFASSTQACNVIALTGDTAGNIKITPGQGCGGPKNEWSDTPQTWNNGPPLTDQDPPLFSIARTMVLTVTAGTSFTITESLALCWAPLQFTVIPASNSLLKQPYIWVGKVTTGVSDTSGYTTSKAGAAASGMTVTSVLGVSTQTITGLGGAGMWEQGRFEWIQDNVGDFARTLGGSAMVLTLLTDCWINNATDGTVRYAKGSTYNVNAKPWIIFKAL